MRIFKAIAITLLALVVAWVAGATWVHLRGPNEAQAAALAVLSKKLSPLASDRNVADDARLQGHVVPAARREAALAAVRALDARHEQLVLAGRFEMKHIDEDPLTDFPALPRVPASPALCAPRDSDCLARVRADPAATATLLEANRQRVQDALALADNDGFRVDRKPSIWASFAMPSDRPLALTALAARFAQGDTDGALAATCRDIAGWRRIGVNSDDLAATVLSAMQAEQAARLLAAMVADRPAGESLPSECAAALAPTADAELDLCQAMSRELAQMDALFDVKPKRDTPLRDQLTLRGVDRERMAYLLAPHFAVFCRGEVLAHARDDRPFRRKVWSDWTCPRWEFVVDPIDCTLVDITASSHEDYASYLNRRMDVAATLALLRTALWLRDTDADPRPRAQRLEQRPQSLGLRRDVRLEGDALVIDRYDTRHGNSLRLPLPPMR